MSKQIREQIKKLTAKSREFKSTDFIFVTNVSEKLLKLEARGEIKCIRKEKLGRIGGATKIYVVVKLYTFNRRSRAEMTEARLEERARKKANPVILTWQRVYPEWFKLPEFKILGTTKHSLS